MNRNITSVIAMAVLVIGSAWVWLGLHTKTVETQTARINAVLDDVERDLGTFDPDSARAIPAMRRIHKATEQMHQKAEENRRLLDSLTRLEREDLGDHTFMDSTASQYDGETRHNSDVGYTSR